MLSLVLDLSWIFFMLLISLVLIELPKTLNTTFYEFDNGGRCR